MNRQPYRQKKPRKNASERILMHQIESEDTIAPSISVSSGGLIQPLQIISQITLGVLVALFIWQGFALLIGGSGSTLGFPDPFDTFQRLYEYLFENRSLYGHSIYAHIAASIRRLCIAFGLAAVVGVVLGSLLGHFKNLYQIGIVPVSIYQMIPGLAWLPIAILLFGLGDNSAIFIIFAVSSMVITIGVSGSIRMVPGVLVHAAKMMGASGPVVFLKVLIPHAACGIVNALRLGMSSAWRVLIAAEMVVGTGIGVGYSIELTRDLLDYVGAFACITTICLIGLFIDRVLLASIERWMRHRLGADAS